MKRRVWVGKMRVDGVPCWHVCGYDRDSVCAERDTWQEALNLALHEVGLATAGHSTYIQEAGDGWSEPMEAWCVCSCGAHVWSWMQTGEPEGAIDGPHDSPWDSWRAHLAAVGLTPTNPEPMEAP